MKMFFLFFCLPILSYGQWQGSSTLQYFNGGNVGIGTGSPINILDVNGVGRFRRQGSSTVGLTIGGDALSLYGWGVNNPYIQWVNSNGTRQGYMGWNTNRLSLILENGFNYTVENGNMGVGTSSPDSRLTVNGGLHVIDQGLPNWNIGFGVNGDPVRAISVDVVNSAVDYDPLELVYHRGTGVVVGQSSNSKFLKVHGTVYSREVNVTLNIPGPDYVFEKDYPLTSLSELKTYIDQHKHLP